MRSTSLPWATVYGACFAYKIEMGKAKSVNRPMSEWHEVSLFRRGPRCWFFEFMSYLDRSPHLRIHPHSYQICQDQNRPWILAPLEKKIRSLEASELFSVAYLFSRPGCCSIFLCWSLEDWEPHDLSSLMDTRILNIVSLAVLKILAWMDPPSCF